MSEIRFCSLIKPHCYDPWTLCGNPFLAQGERAWPFVCCHSSAPAQAGPVHSKSGGSHGASEASAACGPTTPLLSLYFRCDGETPRLEWGVASPAFLTEADPLVSLPFSLGLKVTQGVCGPDDQVAELRPPRNPVRGFSI